MSDMAPEIPPATGSPESQPQVPQTPQVMPNPSRKIDAKIILGAILVIAAVGLAFVYFSQGTPGTGQNAPVPAANPTPAPLPSNSSNATIGISVNQTAAPPPSPPIVDPFAGITPRNISDRISDGQFRLAEDPAAPLRVYAINDGYADAILVNKGDFNILVDAGDFAPVDAYLQKLGISRLNAVVATRDDPGAIGGISQILDKYAVDEFWDNNVQPSNNTVLFVQQSSQYAELLSKVEAEGITIKHPQEGDNLSFAGMKIIALNPQKARQLGNPDVDAVVLKISNGDFCMLLLNPTVQETENVIIGTGEKLRCDVMTYFKHGEGRPTPSLLIEGYAKPKDVIISVGPNSDGLPSPTTLTRLALDSTNVWPTANGTVLVTSTGLGSAYTIAYAK